MVTYANPDRGVHTACREPLGRRPRLLFATGLPAQYYIARMDIGMDMPVPTDTQTKCQHRGMASCFSVKIGEELSKPTTPWPR
jgi:uncharacterized protein (DUF427 family)